MLKVFPVLCRENYMDNYAYIIIDDKTNTAAVIDPSEADKVIEKCDELRVCPQYILDTHHHFDHVDGNLILKEKYKAKIVCNKADMYRIEGADIGVGAGEEFALGEAKAKIIDVSAHTQGHILYYFYENKVLFTGDTLFNLCVGGIFEGTEEEMFRALAKIKALPDDVMFYPGHEYTLGGAGFAFQYNKGNEDIKKYLTRARTRLAQGLPVAPVSLGEEKKCNPYLEAETLQDFRCL